jgi:hypothetical protein
MFVRVKKIGHYEYLYLVENVREGGRHVQRVISNSKFRFRRIMSAFQLRIQGC